MDRVALIRSVGSRALRDQQECVRLGANAFVPVGKWATLERHEQQFLRCYGASRSAHKAVLVGRSAARVSNMWVLPLDDATVELAMPNGKPHHKSQWPEGVIYRKMVVPERDILVGGIDGDLRYTRGARTAIDIARFHGVREGVVAFDSLYVGQSTATKRAIWDASRQAIELMSGKHGIAKAREAFELSTHLSESPYESLVRLILIEHGITPDVQMRIGPFRVDLLWGNLIIEIDGLVKYSDNVRDVLLKQTRRENWLREQGYEVIRLFVSDILRDEAACLARIMEAKRRADARGPVSIPAVRA